jgi:CRP/FNR family transcriptional regulator
VDIKRAIAELNFFSNLSEPLKEILYSISSIKSYPADYLLQYENSHNNQLLFLIKGLAKAYKIDKYDNEIFLYHIHPSHLISEISTLSDKQLISYSNTLFLEESELLTIDYYAFKTHFLDQGLLCMELSSEIIRQSKLLQDLVNREFIFDSVAKVAMMIDSDLKIFNRLKRYDVSLMLHIQPSTLSRVLKRLRHKEIIDIDHGEVKILQKEALKRIYKGLVYE